MYGLIGKFRAKSGQRDALIGAMLDDDTPIPGCLSFVVAHDPADPDVVWITEVWDSQASHKASLEMPTVKASIARAMPLIAGSSSMSRPCRSAASVCRSVDGTTRIGWASAHR